MASLPIFLFAFVTIFTVLYSGTGGSGGPSGIGGSGSMGMGDSRTDSSAVISALLQSPVYTVGEGRMMGSSSGSGGGGGGGNEEWLAAAKSGEVLRCVGLAKSNRAVFSSYSFLLWVSLLVTYRFPC